MSQIARDRRVGAAIATIEQRFGHGAIQQLGATAVADIPAIPIGLRQLDRTIGVGGLPRGRIVEFLGGESVDEVWLDSQESDTPTRVFALSDPVPSSQAAVAERETVHDAAWTPDGQRLLITTQVAASGGVTRASRSRLLRVDAAPGTPVEGAIELLMLPAEVVRSSYSWAPDGRWVAFLTRVRLPTGGSPFVALCAMDTGGDGGVAGFRYLSDLARETAASAVIAPAAVALEPGV